MGKIEGKPKSLTGHVLKAMGLLGSVQGLGVVCSVVRAKLVAIWIGAAGVGVFGLYNSAIDMIASLLHLGLRNSAVKDVASADERTLARVVKAVRRWSGALGILSAVLTMLFAPLLSKATFGDDEHIWGFVALSLALLLTSLTNGELAILQGRQLLSRLAKASVWGVVAGLAVSVPMFYFMGERSIVPSILAYALTTFIATLVYRDRSVNRKVDMTFRETAAAGKAFVFLGIYMTISGFEQMLSNYAFMAYLNSTASETVVGYYNAGNTLFNRYVGLVFAAITMEYFPRLVEVASSRRRAGLYVSHEAALSMWVLLPVITIFIAAAPLIVRLLYSSEFDVIAPFITIAIVGTVFRAISWCMAFVILARGDGPTYIVTETISAVVGFVLNVAGYRLGGLEGLGVAYILWYVIYTVIIFVVYRYRYRLSLTAGSVGAMATVAVVCGVSLASFLIFGWLAATAVAVPACALSLIGIRRLMGKSKTTKKPLSDQKLTKNE